jgi:hypothetical protein
LDHGNLGHAWQAVVAVTGALCKKLCLHPEAAPMLNKIAKYALVSSLFVAGCVAVNATQLGELTARPPLDPTTVVIYRTANQVPRRYDEVALLNATGSTGFTDEKGMLEAMKKRAAKIGANGVILDAISEPSAGAKVAAAIFGVSAERKGKALAIFVHAADSTSTQSPRP